MKANIPLQYACLHSHSTHSDGIYSPEELVRLAKDEGYSALSITDHDTYSAHIEAAEAARKYGIEYLPGIEFSTYAQSGENVHITAFGIDKDYPQMAEYLRLLSARETNETEQLFHRARSLGLIEGIEWEDVLEFNTGITWLCNEQVFRAMKAKGLPPLLQGVLWRASKRGEAYYRIYGYRGADHPGSQGGRNRHSRASA